MFRPPPGKNSPPGTPPDMDFPDDLDGPPDDDFPDDDDPDGFDPPPPPDDDLGSLDDNLDGPPDDDDGPPEDDDGPPDLDGPPDDDDFDLPPPDDHSLSKSIKPDSKQKNTQQKISPPPGIKRAPSGSPPGSISDMGPPPDDSSMGLPPDDDNFDDMSMPPPPDDFSLPPSSPPKNKSNKTLQHKSSFDSLEPPPGDFPPDDFPPDSPGDSFPPPPDEFPPSDSDKESPAKISGPPTKVVPRKAPMRPSTTSVSRPLRQSLNSDTADILSEGLTIKQPNQLQRPARIGGTDLGLNEFKSSRDGDAETSDIDSEKPPEESTLKSTAIETRPKLVRKGKSAKPPAKFKQMMSEITMDGFDTDTITADSKTTTDDDNLISDRPFMSLPPVDYTSRRSSTRRSVTVNGEEFCLVQGKFEGDNFEELMVRISHNTLCIKTEADPNVLIPFDLLNDAKVFLDPNDSCVFTLTQAGSIITFKTPDTKMLNDLLSRVPTAALQKLKDSAPEPSSGSRPEGGTQIPFSDNRENIRTSLKSGTLEEKPGSDLPSSHPESKSKNKSSYLSDEFQFDDEEFYQYESGMMKADELNSTPSNDKNQLKNKQKPKPKPTTVLGKVTLRDNRPNYEDSVLMLTRVKGYDRKELVDTHLQRPKLSIRRMKQICKWMTSLDVWPRPIELPTLYKEICNGLLLAKIMSVVSPDSQYLHLNTKALTKKAALENLEQALGVIWRSKCVNNYRIPSSLEIFNGNTAKISIMMQEIFEVYVLKPLYAVAPKMFKWYHSILKQYGVPLPEEIFTQGDLINLWSHMQSGFDLFCVIYHLYGPVTIGEGLNIVRIDSIRIISNPANILDYRANMIYIFSLLRALNIKIIWDVDDWITYPDTEFLVLQLFFIYEGLKNRQCSLPPAQGTNAGVTSGPNGEPMVTGMIFADTPTSNNRGYQRKRRTVLLGSGHDALPVLPIDTSGDAAGYFRMICPPGLVSTNIKIVHSQIEVKGQRAVSERSKWNASAAKDEIHDRLSGSKQLGILKSSHAMENSKSVDSPSKSDSTGKESEVLKTMKEKLVEDMAELERAMIDSNKEMEELEEELANRYIELEGLSGSLGPVEYNSRLNYLEKERLLLEEQRYKMQEHFSLRLNSLKERHAEAGNRLLTTKKMTTQYPQMNSSSSVRSKKVKESEQAKLHKQERGWNNYSKKQDTHNYALGKGKQKTSSSFMSLAQSSSWNAQMDNAVVNKTGTAFLSPVGKGPSKTEKKDVKTMWNQFKVVLKAETIKWASARSSRHGDKIMELLNQKSAQSTTNKAPTITTATLTPRSNKIPVRVQTPLTNTLIPEEIPEKPSETLGMKIRREELELMQFEETRRRIVIQEKLSSYGNVNSYEMERNPRKTLMGSSANSISGISGTSQFTPFQGYNQQQTLSLSNLPDRSRSQVTPVLMKQQSASLSHQESNRQPSRSQMNQSQFSSLPASPIVNSKNLDAIISWLAFPRNVFLKDRHSQQEYTIVIESDLVNGQELYALKWYEASLSTLSGGLLASPTVDEQSVLKGYIYIQDIRNLQIGTKENSNSLSIQLSSAARALKSSGGRTILHLQFSSESECSKYYQGIQSLPNPSNSIGRNN